MDQPHTIPCARCQRTMYPGRLRQRHYCSAACRQAAYRERRRVTAD